MEGREHLEDWGFRILPPFFVFPCLLYHHYGSILRTEGSRGCVFWQEAEDRSHDLHWDKWQKCEGEGRENEKLYFSVLAADINWQKIMELHLPRFGFVWVWNYLITFEDLIFIFFKKVEVETKKGTIRYLIK